MKRVCVPVAVMLQTRIFAQVYPTAAAYLARVLLMVSGQRVLQAFVPISISASMRPFELC